MRRTTNDPPGLYAAQQGAATVSRLRFCFRLAPLNVVRPWGGDKPSLHWFGLTDGLFWIEAGDAELFRYSDALVERETRRDPPYPVSVYEDYQVVRYWEDLLDLLPAIRSPLPADFAALVRDADRLSDFLNRATAWSDAAGDAENRWETYHEATGWWHGRQWDAGHRVPALGQP